MGSTRRFLPDNIRGKAADGASPLETEHKQRAELFGRYWNYYNGHHRRNLKPPPGGKADDNVTENWSRKIVNEGLRFLFPEPPVFYEDDDETNVTPAEQWLDEYWRADAIRNWAPMQFLQTLGQNGAVCGTAFVKIVTSEGGPAELRAIDPAMVDIETDPDDVQTVTAYNIVYKRGSGNDATWRRQRFQREGPTMWTITEADWIRGRWDVVDEQPWPYTFAPVFHCHNMIVANSTWGASDLEDADLNDAVNFTSSNINRILRFHAHPRTIGTGFSAKAMEQTAVDELWTIQDPAAKVFNLEMQSDLASSREYQAELVEAMHQVAAVPRLDPARVNVGALSGFALRILYGPLLAKTRVKQATYGMLLSQVNSALLELDGQPGVSVRIKWPDALPSSEAERDGRLTALVQAGASLEGAAKIVGYNDEEIQELVNGAAVETFSTR